MKLIEQSYEILSISDSPLQMIEKAGRTCYKSERMITPDPAEKFVLMLRDNGHHAMVEFGYMTVRFITNRGVTHELVRHRLCSFAQESTRYCNYGGKDMEFIKPVWTATMQEWKQFEHALANCELTYKVLLEMGWKPQQAREVLPNALKTEIVVQANLREWRHIFTLRCSKAAHPQMSALMIPLLEEVKLKIPVLYDDIKY